MNAFGSAGFRMEKFNKGFDDLDALYQTTLANPSVQSMREYDRAEAEFFRLSDYQACAEFGRQQAEYLKSLDFMDILTDKIRIYNVCRAKT
eukprot:8545731-Prorocentrum_lima.AAC.1